MNQLTKITIYWKLFEQGLPKSHIAEKLMVTRETVHIWVAGIATHEGGLLGFLEQYTNAKKGERLARQVDPILKRRIWMIRDREMNCCGQKIAYFLDKEYGEKVSVPLCYTIIL